MNKKEDYCKTKQSTIKAKSLNILRTLTKSFLRKNRLAVKASDPVDAVHFTSSVPSHVPTISMHWVSGKF